jgi:DNA-binding NarL/FixJ family response regulator
MAKIDVVGYDYRSQYSYGYGIPVELEHFTYLPLLDGMAVDQTPSIWVRQQLNTIHWLKEQAAATEIHWPTAAVPPGLMCAARMPLQRAIVQAVAALRVYDAVDDISSDLNREIARRYEDIYHCVCLYVFRRDSKDGYRQIARPSVYAQITGISSAIYTIRSREGIALAEYHLANLLQLKESVNRPLWRSLFSSNEQKVLRLAATGMTQTKQIAQKMGTSIACVDTYWKRIYQKLGAHNRAEAMTRALRLGLVT